MIETNLEAIEELILYYECFLPDRIPLQKEGKCPLCIVNLTDCIRCPWVLFEGTACVSTDFRLHTARGRIERLNKWKKLIKGEIENG